MFSDLFSLLFKSKKIFDAETLSQIPVKDEDGMPLKGHVDAPTIYKSGIELKVRPIIEFPMRQKMSKNYRAKTGYKTSLLVIHWLYSNSFEGGIDYIENAGLSCHYYIDVDGSIVKSLDEESCGYHAGVSSHPSYKDMTCLNKVSIGIELMGPPQCLRFEGWPIALLESAISLSRDIASRYPGMKITDHADIADPKGRKDDVRAGKGCDLFPWKEFVRLTEIPELLPSKYF